jgi:hypothetical protein
MTVEYSSFLIRVWREIDADHAPAGERSGDIEHIQSGRWRRSRLSWPKMLIRSGISRSAPITPWGDPSKRGSVMGFTHLRTVTLTRMR